jgi:hypothetical protein
MSVMRYEVRKAGGVWLALRIERRTVDSTRRGTGIEGRDKETILGRYGSPKEAQMRIGSSPPDLRVNGKLDAERADFAELGRGPAG